jgi:hypothetical protein
MQTLTSSQPSFVGRERRRSRSYQPPAHGGRCCRIQKEGAMPLADGAGDLPPGDLLPPQVEVEVLSHAPKKEGRIPRGDAGRVAGDEAEDQLHARRRSPTAETARDWLPERFCPLWMGQSQVRSLRVRKAPRRPPWESHGRGGSKGRGAVAYPQKDGRIPPADLEDASAAEVLSHNPPEEGAGCPGVVPPGPSGRRRSRTSSRPFTPSADTVRDRLPGSLLPAPSSRIET